MARELLETEALGDLSHHVPSDSISLRSIAISLKRIADALEAASADPKLNAAVDHFIRVSAMVSTDVGHDLRIALQNAGQDFAAGMRGLG